MKRIVLFTLLALLVGAIPAFAQEETSAPIYDPEVCAYVPDKPTSQECLDLMAEFPKPELERIPQDRSTLSLYSFWKVGPDAVTKYDAPGGNVVGEIGAGFNFVTVTDESNPDWLQIQGGEWIERAIARYVEPSYFSGVILPENWNQPFAWVLDTTMIYASLVPGGPSSSESGYVTHRYDMVNIFAEAYDSEGWRWYMIGPNQWLKQTFLAKIQPAQNIPDDVSERWVAVDLYEQTLVAYQEGQPVFATLISSGLDNWDTDEGEFNIWARMPTDRMSGAAGAPDAYDLQTVPWTMYFDGSISLHGTYWHDLFGYRRSHGCVNMSISDARYVFDWTGGATPADDGSIVTTVYVFSSGEYGQPPQGS